MKTKNITIKVISTIFYSFFIYILSYTQTFAQFFFKSSISGSLFGNSIGSSTVSPVRTCNLIGVTDFKSLITITINCFLRPTVVIIISLAIAIFLWKIFLYISSDGVEKKQQGREFMFWGIIGIFVMVSLWGLVNVLQRTFTFNNDITPREVNINIP